MISKVRRLSSDPLSEDSLNVCPGPSITHKKPSYSSGIFILLNIYKITFNEMLGVCSESLLVDIFSRLELSWTLWELIFAVFDLNILIITVKKEIRRHFGHS